MALIYICFLRKRWAEQEPSAHFVFYAVSCFVFLVTLSPFFFDIPHLFGGIYNKYNFNPFVDLVNGYGSPLQECIENIILFVPLTYMMRKAFHTGFWHAFFYGVLCSLLIELTQPLISSIRVCDITDMITNSMGALLGCSIYSLIHHSKK
jgi:glycopeptide antibiotics resistance protein